MNIKKEELIYKLGIIQGKREKEKEIRVQKQKEFIKFDNDMEELRKKEELNNVISNFIQTKISNAQ